jgi:hypothetical protein
MIKKPMPVMVGGQNFPSLSKIDHINTEKHNQNGGNDESRYSFSS